ncbi:MAG: F0F1 ATP synthase subunit epsilon [Desulfobacterales bacterium]
MAGNVKLEIVTPDKAIVSEEVKIIMAPGSLGEFGVLTGHTPFLTTLKTGIVRYTDAKGTERYVFVNGGFAEALPNKVTILAESAEKREDIDLDRAKASQKRAEKRLADARNQEDIDAVRAKAALDRALVRINIAGLR